LESRLLGDRRILGASSLAPAMFAREADKKEAASMKRLCEFLREWQHLCSMQNRCCENQIRADKLQN
jgi:hypothetical protein